jgi:pimeloyl-ACP methyl ester carboxylesterase
MDYVRHVGAGSLSGIVLVGGYGGLGPRPSPPSAEITRMLDALHAHEESSDLEENMAAAHDLAKLLTAKTMPDSWVERATHIAMRVPAPVWGYLRTHPSGNQDLVAAVTVPLLLVVGVHDGGTPEPAARALAARIKGAQVAVFESAGHSPFVEEPEHFNQVLAEFARRTATSSRVVSR